jgi:hypothetical protein
MGHPGKHRPSWFGLDEAAIQSLAESVCHPESGLPEGKDDTLCRRYRALPLDWPWCGSRSLRGVRKFSDNTLLYVSLSSITFYIIERKLLIYPTNEDIKSREAILKEIRAPRYSWEVDIMKHLQLVRAVQNIAKSKSYALCCTLAAVHKRAHPGCDGHNVQCFLLPVRGDMDMRISRGKFEMKGQFLTIRQEEHTSKEGTNIRILFRSRPPGAAEQPQTRTNSPFRDEKERWILRLDIQNTVDQRRNSVPVHRRQDRITCRDELNRPLPCTKLRLGPNQNIQRRYTCRQQSYH